MLFLVILTVMGEGEDHGVATIEISPAFTFPTLLLNILNIPSVISFSPALIHSVIHLTGGFPMILPFNPALVVLPLNKIIHSYNTFVSTFFLSFL